jgi:hypothetical protein
MTAIVPTDVPFGEINLDTHSLTGWPKTGPCECGGEAVMLSASYDSADYECRGTAPNRPPHSAYGTDACGRVFTVRRAS